MHTTKSFTSDLDPHLIGDRWREGTGGVFASVDPATGAKVWEGAAASQKEVDAAVAAARGAFPDWRKMGPSRRRVFLEAFADKLREHAEELARLISLEVGKPLWESRTEVDAMIGKVKLTFDAYDERCGEIHWPGAVGESRTRFKPHGVLAVFGPFNFPGHIANGHIAPSLLAGNTVVFKPSEQAPAVARRTVELWQEAELPEGVLNLVQGGVETGKELSGHGGIDGLFFTGSPRTGAALHRLFADYPEKILALEMGGNNPLVVFDVDDAEAAAYLIVQSAYLTSGQRCTCARRLILQAGEKGERIMEKLLAWIRRIRVGSFRDSPEPFMGPVISMKAATDLVGAQEELRKRGGVPLFPMELQDGSGVSAILTPGLMDVTPVASRDDREIFGPFLQVIRVAGFPEAMEEANRTAFGLAAGLISDREERYNRFHDEVRAGIINWNRPLTGASSQSPFGGVGRSGNHRPSGYFAVDSCAYPVASIEARKALKMPARSVTPGFEEE